MASKRNDIVKFKPTGELAFIPDIEDNDDKYGWQPCFICDNVDCYEWATLWTVDKKEMFGCHISDCQLEVQKERV